MEAEVLDAELLEELEGVVDLGQGLILSIGVLAVPRTLGGAGAERIDQLLIERVPPSAANPSSSCRQQPCRHRSNGKPDPPAVPFHDRHTESFRYPTDPWVAPLLLILLSQDIVFPSSGFPPALMYIIKSIS
jgi:hypothetical protein